MDAARIPREAEATGFIHLKPEIIRMIKENEGGKGEVIELAEKAGIQAVKSARDLIPHIRSSEQTHVEVKAWIYPNGIEVKSLLSSPEPASLESESLMAVITALVTLFELCREIDSAIIISDIKLVRILRH
jgi:cyclic pyranopterin phosphate synthase